MNTATAHTPRFGSDLYRTLWGNRSGIGKLVAGSMIVGLVTRNAAICALGVLAGLVIANRNGIGGALKAAGEGLQFGKGAPSSCGTWSMPSFFKSGGASDQFRTARPVLESDRLRAEVNVLREQHVNVCVNRERNSAQVAENEKQVKGLEALIGQTTQEIDVLTKSGAAVPPEMTQLLAQRQGQLTDLKADGKSLTDQSAALTAAESELFLKLNAKQHEVNRALTREQMARNAAPTP